MASSQANAEASHSSDTDDTSRLIHLKILSPSPEVRDGLAFTSLSASTTVGQLKEKIRATLPSRPSNERQRLIYRGRVMADDTQSMQYIFGEDAVKQQKEHTLHLVIPETASQAGSAPHSNTVHRQPQPATNPFQHVPRPNQSPNVAPQANPFRNIMAGQRSASVPPMQGMQPTATQVPSVPAIPGMHQHMVHMQAMQHQVQQLQQRVARASGTPQSNAPSLPNGQVQANRQGEAAVHGQRESQGPTVNQGQSHERPGQSQQNGHTTSSMGGPAQPRGTTDGSNNFTRSGVGPHGQSWTFTVNTTSSAPQPPHMQMPMPMQIPHAFPPFPFGQMPGQVQGQNLQFGPLPVMGLPHPPTMNGVQLPRGPNLEAQIADLERFVQEQQRRVENLSPASGDVSARAESDRIRNDLHDAMTQLYSLRARTHNALTDLNPATARDPTLQLQGSMPRASAEHSAAPSSSQQTGQQSTAPGHSAQNIQVDPVTTESSSTAPIVYLLSSPMGPVALLLSSSGTYSSPGSFQQQAPQQQNDFVQQHLRAFHPNMPHLLPGSTLPQARQIFNRQNYSGNSPNQAGNMTQRDGTHADPQQQQPGSGGEPNNLPQNQDGRQQLQHVPQIPLVPDQPRRNIMAPGQVARGQNAQNAPVAQGQGQGQGQGQRVAQGQQNLGAIAGHLWVVVRILGFLWLFFGGSNVGFVRPFVIGVVAFLAYAAQQQGPVRRFGERVREHVEGLLRPEEEAARRRHGHARRRQEQADGHIPVNAGARGQPPPDPAVAATRIQQTSREARRSWMRAQLLSVERAMALFLASLWPGVGERHVQARERERRQREEEEARQRREQEERDRLQVEEEEARAKADEEARRESEAAVETVGLRSPPPPDQEGGLRERRQAVVAEEQTEPIENGSSGTKGKGKQPVRGELEDAAEGAGTGADPTS